MSSWLTLHTVSSSFMDREALLNACSLPLTFNFITPCASLSYIWKFADLRTVFMADLQTTALAMEPVHLSQLVGAVAVLTSAKVPFPIRTSIVCPIQSPLARGFSFSLQAGK